MIPIQKAFFLLDKGDLVGAEQVLATVTNDDLSVRASYLALRAYLFCVQKKNIECLTLSTDANTLDPLSPLALKMLAIAQSYARDR